MRVSETRRRLARLGLVVVASLTACREAPAPPVAIQADGAVMSRAPGPRYVWLGRLVEMNSFAVVKTLVDVPDVELTDDRDGLGVVQLSNNQIGAFDLSTGEAVWVQTPYAPCGKLQLVSSRVYAACGNKLLGYAVKDGAPMVADPGPYEGIDPVLSGGCAFSLHAHDRLEVHDLETGARRASKVLPELERAFRQYILPDPSGRGACVLGIFVGPDATWRYEAGCYEETLTRRWSKSFKRPAASLDDIRQLGPRYLVLDDQRSPDGEGLPRASGRGMLLRWQDGRLSSFDDGTFATFEDPRGERLRPDLDVFRLTRDLDVAHELLALHEARIVDDGERAFALVVNGATGLAGVDRATGMALFTVPVALGQRWEIGVAGRYPVVRTRFAGAWVLSVHDPFTGEVLYRDTRPWAPPAWRAPVLMPPRCGPQ